jgi:7-cyano-7-deazaguanine reductase
MSCIESKNTNEEFISGVVNMPVKKKPALRKTSVPILEVFTNPHPGRQYTIEIIQPEFTSVCPQTGQPDFGTVTLTYIPDKACLELKSLKHYLQQYRNQGIFYEDITNRILDDLVAACQPMHMQVHSCWSARGGIRTNVTAEYTQPVRAKK